MSSFSLALLASGQGSNCQAIHKAIEAGDLAAHIGVVISNNAEAGVLEWAKAEGLPARHISSGQFATLDEFYDHFLGALRDYRTDLIVLAGYLKKIGRPILQAYPGRVVNIHPALLPAFGGKGMYGHRVHEAVIAYGARVTGVTVHLVDEEYDHGPIVLQETLPVLDDDTPDTLSARVLQLEHRTYSKALQLFAEGRVEVAGRRIRIKKESMVAY